VKAEKGAALARVFYYFTQAEKFWATTSPLTIFKGGIPYGREGDRFIFRTPGK
jgi:hypothetical protein